MNQEVLSDAWTAEICRRLENKQRIRTTLPAGGQFFMDRPLPFLAVYRHPRVTVPIDGMSASLVRGEAAFLVMPEQPQYFKPVVKLVERIALSGYRQFGSFLIIEIWPGYEDPDLNANNFSEWGPRFKLYLPSEETSDFGFTHNILQQNLERIRILKRDAEVKAENYRILKPGGGLTAIMSRRMAREVGIHHIGIEVAPIYLNSRKNETFPLVFNRLHRGVAHALRRAFFDFTSRHTNFVADNVFMLGRRAVNKVVLEVDHRMAEISRRFDFLLQVTPVNAREAWNQFQRKKYEVAPVLKYRPMPVDPPTVKRDLFSIKISRVEDPTLAAVFREKREELDRQLTMLLDRGTRKFLYGSLQLFGGVPSTLRVAAEDILNHTSGRSSENSRRGYATAEDFKNRAQQEYDYFRSQSSGFSTTTLITDEIAGLMASQGRLLVSKSSRIPLLRVEALIQHEVGTHILTHFNGRQQAFQLLAEGLAGYDELQEGIAVLSEYLVDGLTRDRLRLLAGRVIASHLLIQGASFVETFRMLDRTYDFNRQTAFNITLRTYRGGGLTKDSVYLRGLLKLMDYIQKGGDIRSLLVGKVSLKHVPFIEELQHRKIIKSPSILPSYMNLETTEQRLNRLKEGLKPLDLVHKKEKSKKKLKIK